MRSIENAGYRPGRDIGLGLDTARSEFHNDSFWIYDLASERRRLSSGEFVDYLAAQAQSRQPGVRRVLRKEASLEDSLVREASDRHFHLGLAQATGNGSLELVVVEIRNRRAEMWRRTQQHFHTRKLAE
jgi:DNA-binding FadR family transcriptional regulator